MEYDDLLQIALEKIDHIDALFKNCDLPEEPDEKAIEELLCHMRLELYQKI
jgi:hypothetical protein